MASGEEQWPRGRLERMLSLSSIFTRIESPPGRPSTPDFETSTTMQRTEELG
jgi:hypothetical protein